MQKPSARVVERASLLLASNPGEIRWIVNELALTVFEAAKHFMRSDRTTRYIFVGRGMRPFFDTVWHLNSFSNRFPPENLRYYTIPRAGLGNSENSITELSGDLTGRGLISPTQRNYRIIDYMSTGRTFERIKSAIKLCCKNASVRYFNQQHRVIGTAINLSDDFPASSYNHEYEAESLKESGELFWRTKKIVSLDRARHILLKSELYRRILEHERSNSKI